MRKPQFIEHLDHDHEHEPNEVADLPRTRPTVYDATPRDVLPVFSGALNQQTVPCLLASTAESASPGRFWSRIHENENVVHCLLMAFRFRTFGHLCVGR